MMEAVLKHMGTLAWASDRLTMSVKTSVSLSSTGPEHASRGCHQGQQPYIHECQGLVVCRAHSLDGCVLVVPVNACIKAFKLI